MTDPEKCPLRSAELSVVEDPIHGGGFLEYKILSTPEGYRILCSADAIYQSRCPSNKVLADKNQEGDKFLKRLVKEFDVFKLKDLKPPKPSFLHPTLYHFSFTNTCGYTHQFKYRIEAYVHSDKKYRRLVQAFENFFS